MATRRARDGSEALRKLEDSDVSLIITDIRMPRMGGLEFIARLRDNQKHRDTPRIVMSSDEPAYHCISSLKLAGIDEWLEKPFKIPDLIRSVRKYLPQDSVSGVPQRQGA